MTEDSIRRFEASVPGDPPSRFKPMGTYYSRQEALTAAHLMSRQVPYTKWEPCLIGARFQIRRAS